MLKKISVHTYTHTSYQPVFDKGKLEGSSLLRLRRSSFVSCRTVCNGRISKNIDIVQCLLPRLYMRDLNPSVFSDYLRLVKEYRDFQGIIIALSDGLFFKVSS